TSYTEINISVIVIDILRIDSLIYTVADSQDLHAACINVVLEPPNAREGNFYILPPGQHPLRYSLSKIERFYAINSITIYFIYDES
ncbi:MAG: hypothetical protein MUO58_14725, partial [Anaerolineales bacterium]|nr:hypothetical protein [Anaerolineales bacterium]